ncbi:MAG: tetratricopeptide repeat protein [Planctomycetes bacterium]|nr:tetratricopeptide repeat protein [Planctomycetota bacterium]
MSGSLVLACMVTVVAGCAEDVKDIRTEGIHQFRNHQHIESMATLRYALRKEPNDAECNYYMGLNYRALAERRFQEGDLPAAKRTLDVALFYFTQAVKSWPNYMAAVQAKTEALASRGKYDSALSVAETVADNNRGVADHFVFLGDEYRARADYDNALRAYKTALASDPQNARAYAGMARLYWQVGDRELAVDTFTRAHELNPAEPDAAEALAELEHSGESHMAAPLPRVLPPQEPSGSGTSRIYSGE